MRASFAPAKVIIFAPLDQSDRFQGVQEFYRQTPYRAFGMAWSLVVQSVIMF
jgi:hypothetical protein